jgi:hypothetical protein
MSQSAEPKAQQPKSERMDGPLPESELQKISGGKVSNSDIVVTKPSDKSTPSL